MQLAFGGSFDQAAGVLPMLAAGAAALALLHVLVNFHIALGTRAYLFVLGGVVLEVALVALFHETPMQIALALLVSSAVVALLLLQAARSAVRWAPARALEFEVASPGSVDDDPPKLSIVLPCHNGGRALCEVIEGLRADLQGQRFEVVVVSDGSTDDTVGLASALASDDVRVLHYADRVGKGHALRVGLGEARGRYVAFMDSDGDIAPASLGPFVEIMRLFGPDIVLGSKRHPLSEVEYPALRRAMSWSYHKLSRLLFRVDVRDTQAGIKLIRREVLEAVLPVMVEKRYAFDLELLVAARRRGFRRVFEAPIRLDYKFSSNVNVRATGRVLLDTLAIFYRRYLLDAYAPTDGHGGSRERVRRRKQARRAGDGLRVVFVNWRDIRNPEAGGAEVWTHEVAKRWAAQGVEVWLLTSGFRGAPRVETIDGVRVKRLGRLRTGTFHLLVQKELARLRGFDVVIDEINAIPFLTPLWRHRLPTVVGLIHQLAVDVWDAELPKPLAAAGRWAEPRLLGLYRDVPMVAVSESTRADLEALGIAHVDVVRGGRDAAPELSIVEKEPVPTFLFAGRLAQNKRPDHAIEAFRAIRREQPDARLWIAGQGPLAPTLRDSLPEGAELLGYVAREELYERMARAHALLVPSVREGWGLVVIEANSVGTPAVGYDVHGIRDSVRDGVTGLLASAGSPDDLAAQALRLVEDPESYAATCERARAWAARFAWDRTAEEMLSVVTRAAAQAAAPVPEVSLAHAR